MVFLVVGSIKKIVRDEIWSSRCVGSVISHNLVSIAHGGSARLIVIRDTFQFRLTNRIKIICMVTSTKQMKQMKSGHPVV